MLRLSREGGSWKEAANEVVVRIDARGAGVLTEKELLLLGLEGGGGANAAVASFAVGESGRVGVKAQGGSRFVLERVEQVGPSPDKGAPATAAAALRRVKAVSAEKFTPFTPGEHALVVRPRPSVGGGNGNGNGNGNSNSSTPNKQQKASAPPAARYALLLSKGLLLDIEAAKMGLAAAAAATTAGALQPPSPPLPTAAEPAPAPSSPVRPPAPPPPDQIYRGLRLAQWDLSVAQKGVVAMFVKKGGELAGGGGGGGGASGNGAAPPPPPPPWLLERGRTTHVLVADGLTVEDAMARLRQQEQYERQQGQQQPEEKKKRARPADTDDDADEDEDDDENHEPARLLALIPPATAEEGGDCDGPVFVRQSFFVACNAQRRLITAPHERAPYEVGVRAMLQVAADRLRAERDRRQHKKRKRLSGGEAGGGEGAGGTSNPAALPNAPKPPAEELVLRPGEPWGAGGRWIEPWDEQGARRTVRKLRRWYRRACQRGRKGRVPTVEEEAEDEARLLREADEDTDDDLGSGEAGLESGSDDDDDDGGGGGAAAAAAGAAAGGVGGGGGGNSGGSEDEEEAKEAAWRYFAETAAAGAGAGAGAAAAALAPATTTTTPRQRGRRPCTHPACARRPDICLVSELLLIGELQGPKSREGNNYHRNRALAEGARTLRKLRRPLDDAEAAKRTLRAAGVTGTETLEKILTILREGRHPRVTEHASDPANAARARLSRAWGVSQRKADEWFFSRGWSTPAQVLEGARRGLVQLSAMQRCGLEHYDDFLRRIPREEVAEAERLVAECAREAVAEALAERAGGGEALQAALEEELASSDPACLHARVLGSYVRGQSRDCGDIDVLIAVADETPVSRRQILREVPPRELMRRLLLRLRAKGWLLPDMLEQWMAAHGGTIGGPKERAMGQFGVASAGGADGVSASPLLPDSSSFSGAWRGPGRPFVRRFDAKWYSRAQLATGTLYFGSGTRFCRQMRLFAATPPLSLKRRAAQLAAQFHGPRGSAGNCFHLSDKELSVAYRPPNVPLHYAGGPTTQTQRTGGSYNTQGGNAEHVVGPNVAVANEREVFEALGLEYVPPHLRELD